MHSKWKGLLTHLGQRGSRFPRDPRAPALSDHQLISEKSLRCQFLTRGKSVRASIVRLLSRITNPTPPILKPTSRGHLPFLRSSTLKRRVAVKRRVSLCDDRHIFTERYLQRREYHKNEVETVSRRRWTTGVDWPQRILSWKPRWLERRPTFASNRSKMKVLAREKATFRNCLVFPDVVSLYKTTRFSNGRPLSGLCYKRLRYDISAILPGWNTRGGSFVRSRPVGK